MPTVFLIHPVFEKDRSYSEYTLSDLHQRLKDVAAKEELIVLDLLNTYKNYNPDDIKQHSKQWYDCWHPNIKGHAIVAESLYDLLISSKMQ